MSDSKEIGFEISTTWAAQHRDAAQVQALADEALLEERIAAAIADGKESFDASKLMDFYYPNDWPVDEADVLSRVESFKKDYYHSDAMTLEEWAKEREAIEAQGDS